MADANEDPRSKIEDRLPDGQDKPDAPRSEGKLYTEAEVTAMVTGRLSKHEKSLRKQFDEEKAKELERAKMDEAERLKSEKAEVEGKLSAAEARAVRAERKAELAGKVVDPEAALALVKDAHLTDEGGVDVAKLLETYPFLAPQKQTPALDGPNPPGGVSKDPSKQSDEEYYSSRIKK